MLAATRWFSAWIAMIAAVHLGTAQAKPVVLEPVTPWNVDWSDQTCTLQRDFGSKERPRVLIFERFGPSSTFQFRVVADELGALTADSVIYTRFGEHQRIRVKSFIPARSNGVPAVMMPSKAIIPMDKFDRLSVANNVSPEMEAAVKHVTITVKNRETTFATGSLDKPFAALRACTDDLVRSWGLDPAVQKSLSASPELLIDQWEPEVTYPPEMVAQNENGMVYFRLMIDEKGTPTSCTITRSFSNPRFEKDACNEVVKNLKFSPALDASGKPTASYYNSRVEWKVHRYAS